MKNQNDIYSLLKNGGLNAETLLAAAQSGNANALLDALPADKRRQVEKAIKSGEAQKLLSDESAKSIINLFGEINNG